MVLVPSWTEAPARACEFPANVAELFPELRRTGLFAHSKLAFWMPDAEREQARSFLLASFSQALFDEQAARIAPALLRAASDPRAPPPPRRARSASPSRPRTPRRSRASSPRSISAPRGRRSIATR